MISIFPSRVGWLTVVTQHSTQEAEVNRSQDHDGHKFRVGLLYTVSSRPLGLWSEISSVGESPCCQARQLGYTWWDHPDLSKSAGSRAH